MTLRRVLGALLLAALLLPGHRLLDPDRTGLAGSATRAAAEPAWRAGLLGLLLVGVSALLLARLSSLEALRRRVGGLTRRLAVLPGGAWSAAVGGLALVLSGTAARLLFEGRPTSVDAMVQLLHARALLAGRMALELPGPAAAWLVQNGTLTPHGWASVYPPGHTAWLAVWLAAGAPWLAGPVAVGAGAALTALSLDRLLAPDPGVARWAALAVATSPFLALLGGTHLSHPTAMALAALVLWSALRAREGSARSGGVAWALLTGAAVGALVLTRPWVGLALGTTLPAAAWLPRRGPSGAHRRRLLPRALGMAAGGLPFAAVLLAWNAHLFGHPLRLGYTAAFGPAHGLGFHPDPWGNAYGLVEAAGYTGTDLLLLGTHLLETPLSALLPVAVALLVAPRLLPGAGPLLAWAGAAVAAAALYWHHGIHLGPRMLYESGPAWAALSVVAVAALLRDPPAMVGRTGPAAAWWRGAVAWAVALALVGAAALLPGRLERAEGAAPGAAATLPALSGTPFSEAPALVLVHGSWPSRVSARLAASGMRRDSVETLLRRNDLCQVHLHARWRGGAGGPEPPVARVPRPGRPPGLVPVELSPGNRAYLDPSRPLAPSCTREARADAVAGTVELEPLLWRLPPLPGSDVLLARDLGPGENAALLAAHPERTPWLAVAGEADGPLRLLPYRQGMDRVWGVRDGG